MSANAEEEQRSTTRKRLIEVAQMLCYEARSKCLRAKSQYGRVPRVDRIGFQIAIVDYYWALRPLRKDAAVAELWKNEPLSEGWTGDNGEPITGLDAINEVDDITVYDSVKEVTMRGGQENEVPRDMVLPFPVLKDISGVLDDAAGKLGFNPETPKQGRPFRDWREDGDDGV